MSTIPDSQPSWRIPFPQFPSMAAGAPLRRWLALTLLAVLALLCIPRAQAQTQIGRAHV